MEPDTGGVKGECSVLGQQEPFGTLSMQSLKPRDFKMLENISISKEKTYPVYLLSLNSSSKYLRKK